MAAKAYAASTDPHVVAAFRALVEAIVPAGPPFAGDGMKAPGAMELG